MKWTTSRTARIAALLTVWLAWAPTVFGDNIVVDGLNGDDGNSGITPTGGPGDLAALDFSNAFKTIAKGTEAAEASEGGDFIFVNAGTYSEQVEPKTSTTYIAVGEAVIEGAYSGFGISSVSNVVVDGFTIINCTAGVATEHSKPIQLQNLTIRSCATGISLAQGHQAVTIRRCVITDCERGIYGGQVAVERCTLVANECGVQLYDGAGGTLRNSIVAYNSKWGIAYSQGAFMDFNDVFSNGTNYFVSDPGPNDVSVDPQFIDLSRRILLLKPTSPLINAGEELGGGPAVTIGAREIGFASSNALDAWADWIDEAGSPVASSALVEIDAGTGHIVLKPGVNRAAVRGPVYNKGPLKSVEFAALEDLAPASGSRLVIDQDDATFQRELRFRGSATSFLATDAQPAFEAVFEGQVLNLATNLRYVQVELTLTRTGK